MNTRELQVGDDIPERTYEDIKIEEMRLMSAIMRDYNPLHFDPRAAEESGYSKRLTQGPIFASYTAQAVYQLLDNPYDIQSYQVRFEDNVFEGDTLTVTGTVTDREEHADDVVLTIDLETAKPDGTVVLSGAATVQVS